MQNGVICLNHVSTRLSMLNMFDGSLEPWYASLCIYATRLARCQFFVEDVKTVNMGSNLGQASRAESFLILWRALTLLP